MRQRLLFHPEALSKDRWKKFEIFFDILDLPAIERSRARGRNSVNKANLLRALIFKNLRGFPTLNDLVTELLERPSLAYILSRAGII